MSSARLFWKHAYSPGSVRLWSFPARAHCMDSWKRYRNPSIVVDDLALRSISNAVSDVQAMLARRCTRPRGLGSCGPCERKNGTWIKCRLPHGETVPMAHSSMGFGSGRYVQQKVIMKRIRRRRAYASRYAVYLRHRLANTYRRHHSMAI